MKIIIALGGNAISRDGKASYNEQVKQVRRTARQIVALIKAGHKVIITHGNGPQVGDLLLQQEIGKKAIPPMPLSVCGAESQGEIGYMIQQQLYNELKNSEIKKEAVTLITQVLVDYHDPAFKNPTKPVGPFYKSKKKGSAYQIGKGWRKVVASPMPQDVIEKDEIIDLVNKGRVVIACGGGGIPVVRKNGKLIGVDAVIDKDRATALLGKIVGADLLLILTDVEYAYLNFGEADQKPLRRLKLAEANKYLKADEFKEGSMKPKVESCIQFIRQGGKRAIITSLEKASDAISGKTGTVIMR